MNVMWGLGPSYEILLSTLDTSHPLTSHLPKQSTSLRPKPDNDLGHYLFVFKMRDGILGISLIISYSFHSIF